MWWHALQHWLAYHTGSINEPGVAPWSAFYGGVGSDLSEVALIGAALGVLRRINCEVKGCWRLGRHRTAAQHSVCRKHHPDDHLTARDIHAAHHAAKGGDRDQAR